MVQATRRGGQHTGRSGGAISVSRRTWSGEAAANIQLRVTSRSANSPVRGWVLYDGHCGFCVRSVRFWKATLERHGFATAALDEAWVGEKLKLPYEELVREIRLLTVEGELISGADVYLYVARRVWWAWLFYAVFRLPGLNGMIHAGYRWFARNRHSVARACGLGAE